MKFPEYFSYLKKCNLIWFNPCFACLKFWDRLSEFQKENNFDFDTAWKNRGMKRNKELYALAITALCMQQDFPTPHGWWFTKPEQDPPDGLIGTPISDPKENENIMHGREVEITEYLGGSIVETIQKKLSRKAYEPNTILVCLLSPKDIESIDFKSISEQIQKMSLSLKHIFVAGNGCFISATNFKKLTDEEKIKKLTEVFLVELSPKYGAVSVSPNECLKKNNHSGWLKFNSIKKGIEFKKDDSFHPKLYD